MHEPQPFLRSAVRLQLCHTHSLPPDKQRRGPPRQGGLEVDGEATADPAATEPHPSLEAATGCAESRRRRGGDRAATGPKAARTLAAASPREQLGWAASPLRATSVKRPQRGGKGAGEEMASVNLRY